MIGELHIVAGVGLVDGEDLQHVPVVFLQEALHPFGVPVGRRGADCVNRPVLGVEGRCGLDVGQRVSAVKLRHFHQFALVGIRQAQDVVICDELFQLVHGGPGVGKKAPGVAVFPADGGENPGDGLMASGFVIGREGHSGVIPAPELSGGDVHLTRNAMEFALGAGQDLVGGNVAIDRELQFSVERFLSQPPVPGGTFA